MSKKIMIVDDEAAIRETLELILQEEGYDVSTSVDGEILSRYMNGSTPDLIILDHWLPVKNGDEIAHNLKQRPDTKNIPIIMISASNNIRQIAQIAGADDYIPKPFEFDTVVDKVKKYIQ